MKVVVTSFEPFGGDTENASIWSADVIANALRKHGHQVVTTALPVTFSKSALLLQHAVAKHKPDLLLCIGEAGRRSTISLEVHARNLIHARIPDNEGEQPQNCVIDPARPQIQVTSMQSSIADIVQAAAHTTVPVKESTDAGTFVCNFVTYHAYSLNTAALFIHVPAIRTHNEANVGAETDPGISKAVMPHAKDLRASLETLAIALIRHV